MESMWMAANDTAKRQHCLRLRWPCAAPCAGSSSTCAAPTAASAPAAPRRGESRRARRLRLDPPAAPTPACATARAHGLAQQVHRLVDLDVGGVVTHSHGLTPLTVIHRE
jgi:hypothetical protein